MHRIFLTSLGLFFGLSVLAVAQSFPMPGKDKDTSLLGVIIKLAPDTLSAESRTVNIEGPSPLSIKVEKPDVLWFKVDPGLYKVTEQDTDSHIDIPPQSVTLAPFALVLSTSGVALVRINEQDRQEAGKELVLHLKYPHWMDRNWIGFGALRPDTELDANNYSINITSKFPDTMIFVNDVFAGETPLNFLLPQGKHRITAQAQDYEDSVYYIRLEGNTNIDVEMYKASENNVVIANQQYQTLIAPFLSLDEPDDQLSRLFADTLLLSLENDPRLKTLPSSAPWISQGALIHPNFLALEEVGADFLVSGFFGMQDNMLTVQANLYDVQSESIRAAVTWYGTASLNLFDAMDEIVKEFTSEVDRVLPNAGRAFITRERTLYAARNTNEIILAQKRISKKRWEENPTTLSLAFGFSPFSGDSVRNHLNEPFDIVTDNSFEMLFLAGMDFKPFFAVAGGVKIQIGQKDDNTENSVIITDSSILLNFFVGPQLVFRNNRLEASLGLNADFGFSPQNTVLYDKRQKSSPLGPFLFASMGVTVDARFYLNKLSDTIPTFLSLQAVFKPFTYRFDLNQDYPGWLLPQINLNMGIGVRL